MIRAAQRAGAAHLKAAVAFRNGGMTSVREPTGRTVISFLIDLLSVFGRPALFGMDQRRSQSGTTLLLSRRRQNANPAIPDLENGLVGIAVATRWSPLTATSSISSAIV